MNLLAKQKSLQLFSIGAILVFSFLLFYSLDLSLICYLHEVIPDKLSAGLKSTGGFNEIIVLHIISLFHFKAIGYAFILIMPGLFFLSLQLLFKTYARHPFFQFSIFLIAIALLLPLFNYTYSLKITGSIIFSTYVLTIAYFIAEKTGKFKIPLFLLSLFVNYYLFGLPGFYFSSVVLIAHKSTSFKFKLIYLLALIALPALSMAANINFSIQQAYIGCFVSTIYESVKPSAIIIYILTPLLLIFLQSTEHKANLSAAKPKKQRLFSMLQFISIIILAIAVFCFSFNSNHKITYKIESLAQERKWTEVLNLAKQLSAAESPLVQFHINRAIYDEGHFLDNLFMYPQLFGIDALFLDYASNGTLAQAKADLYFDMGYGNDSRHWANESLTSRGNKPHTLKCLIINYAASQQYSIAKRYWNLLNRSVVYKKWSQINEGILNGEINEDIARLQNNFPEDDFFTGIGTPQLKLEKFYARNPENQMAFEYLIANYLLIHNIGKLASEIPEFERLGYKKLPRLVEEALLVYSVQKNVDKLDLRSFKIDEKTQQDFKNFSLIIQSAGSKEKGKQAVKSFSHTYWYYLMFDSKYQKKLNS
ncbi:MAG: DUF6057 family protein [Bacteroidales bacterium]|nr:DUF6057 family protein [Bacteroidales bacterium]MCF8389857.1 DUF6057 family protein [Bacteroidales bacterium]